MKIEQRKWPVSRLIQQKDAINLNPRFQRGAAWQPPRQVLLIDSVLRGMDIPKIYLRRNAAGSPYDHDAVDGQQRLRAMFEFRAGDLALAFTDPLPPIDGHNVHGLTYGQLHKDLRERFDAFEVVVSEIIASTQDEISSLFSRLQMGVSLNPAELRNAMGGPLQHTINVISETHEFFVDSRISGSRYKKADYATLLFGLAANGDRGDLKAPNLKALIASYGPDRAHDILEMAAEVGDALNVLAEVNAAIGRKLTQKWIVVDLGWLLMERQRAGQSTDATKLAAAFNAFSARRLEFTSKPEVLIRGSRRDAALDRHLYNYINAFRLQPALAQNIRVRATALRAFLVDISGRA
ncbi:DUF262 domain-containing protein [Sphingomonas sp. 28-62-11]|uniref:DUF262 domain-containing protein n=1 Tax=Sphingomonas sp. 28-62-11 TaxID=1970432 RepID=UPI000BC95189|nr:MAG: hypothetical protein B7Y49_02085 [Sphingomonas sp. 28-62-11]